MFRIITCLTAGCRIILLFLLLLPFVCSNVLAQPHSTGDTLIAPGPEYEMSDFMRFFLGDHWRDTWVQPVRVPFLDLESFHGGLTPLRQGGGMQTKSLRFIDSEKRIWKFRQINKDPAKILPPEIRESFVEEVLQDQVSSALPLAAFVVAPLLDAAGLHHAPPQLCVMPDHERLDEFRGIFANTLGTIEEHPDEEGAGYHGFERVFGTYKLFERLEEHPFEQVATEQFITARLIDALIGDWDRHADQWRWGRTDSAGTVYWSPIPRDRDQAFAKFDGIIPRLAEMRLPQINSFNAGYPSPEKLSWNGKHLDQRLLVEPPYEQWQRIAQHLQSVMTDSLLRYAVQQLPGEHYHIAGGELLHKLKQRRDNLPEYAEDFYRWINTYSDIFGSEKTDLAEVTRLEDSTRVELYLYDHTSRTHSDAPYFSKVFDNSITEDIRIYLLDDDDIGIVRGRVSSGPTVRIIGGGGEDLLIDSSCVEGYLFSFLPVPYPETRTRLYDHGDESVIIPGAGTYSNRDDWPDPETDEERFEPSLRDRGSLWIVQPIVTITTEDGFIAGIRPTLFGYNFRKDPYEYMMQAELRWASEPNSASLEFNGIFNSFLPSSSFHMDALLSQLQFTKYFGYGNETPYDENRYEDDYYRLRQRTVIIAPDIHWHLTDNLSLLTGISYQYSDISFENRDLIATFPDGLYGLGRYHLARFHTGFIYDSRNKPTNPLTGFYFSADATLAPGMFDMRQPYYRGKYEARLYLPLPGWEGSTLALRTGGEKLWGEFPFFEGAFLGGPDDLRGYNHERFSGDAAIFGQAELRLFLTRARVIVIGDIGLHLFAETGRVFVRQQESDMWHPSYGGGFWMSLLDRQFTGTVTIAFSKETQLLFLGAAMSF